MSPSDIYSFLSGLSVITDITTCIAPQSSGDGVTGTHVTFFPISENNPVQVDRSHDHESQIWQISAWADKLLDADALATVIKNALQAHEGLVGSQQTQLIQTVSKSTDYNETVEQYVIHYDFEFFYNP